MRPGLPNGDSPPVLLLGIDRLLGLQLARILGGHGVPVVGVAMDPGSPYCRTRWAERILDAESFQEDPVRHLAALRSECGARPVVIPCLDEMVWWLDAQREPVAKEADFLLAPSEVLRRLGDKVGFHQAAGEQGLLLPPTRIVSERTGLEAAAREMRFPVVIKPRRRSPEWMARTDGFKVLRVEDPAALLEAAPALLEATDALVLQSWIDGGDECMVSLYVCLDARSQPVVPCLVAHKLRQWPPDVGVGSLVEAVRDDALVEAGLSFLQAAGYVGPGSLQFKRDPGSGLAYAIEMNTRTPLCFPLFEACGVEATLSAYRLAAGLPLPEARQVTRPNGRWISWKRDLASAYVHWRRGELSLRAWLGSLAGPARSADLQLRDPMPTLADLGRKLFRGPSRKARKALESA